MNFRFLPQILKSPPILSYNYAQNCIIKSNKHFKKAINMSSCTFYNNKNVFYSNFLEMKNFLLNFLMFV